MKKLRTLLLSALLAVSIPFSQAADVKISQLPLGSASSSTVNDSFPYVQSNVNITKRLTLWDLVNLPPMTTTYASLISPTFTGTVTAGGFSGNLTGTATYATSLAPTGNVDIGAFTFAAKAFGATGTGGSGYLELKSQSAAPSAPSAGFREYASSTGALSWIRQSDGFTRTIDSTLTANRTFALPDANTTLVGTDATQTLTNKTLAAASNTITGLTNSNVSATAGITLNKTVGGVTAAADTAYAVLTTDYYVTTTPSISRTITLPTAVGVSGQIYVIQMLSGAGTNPIATTSAQTIGGRASSDIVLRVAGDYVKVISDNANWQILTKKETQYITSTSTTVLLSSFSNNTFAALTGNSVTATYGQWTCGGMVTLWGGSAGSNISISANPRLAGFYAANGTGTNTAPTALTGTTGFLTTPIDSLITGGVILLQANQQNAVTFPTFDISVTSNTAIFLVPFLNWTTSSNSEITESVWCRRVW